MLNHIRLDLLGYEDIQHKYQIKLIKREQLLFDKLKQFIHSLWQNSSFSEGANLVVKLLNREAVLPLRSCLKFVSWCFNELLVPLCSDFLVATEAFDHLQLGHWPKPVA